MRFLRIFAVLGALAMGATACADLDVVNENDPEAERALAEPGDVESLIGGSFRTWWYSTRTYSGSGLALSVMGWEHSSSHGNRRMWISSRMPREKIPVHPSEPEPMVIETPWYFPYRAIVSATDGIRAIKAGVEMPGGQNPRALAFGRFVQGIGHAHIALLFDRGFIMDETINIAEDPPQLVPYSQVMEAAIGYLDEAIELAEKNEFTIPSAWINGLNISSADFAKILHSYKARFLAQVARTPAERAAVDWEKVILHASKGVTEVFAPKGDGAFWYSEILLYGNYPTWSQMSYRHFGRGDVSGGYQKWMSDSWVDKRRFLMVTPDQRWPQGTTAEAQAANPGTYFSYTSAQPFQVARGLYYPSFYRDHRYDDSYVNITPAHTGLMPEILPAEMWALQAEGHIRRNRPDQAIEFINRTRVANGGLPAVTAAGVPGGDQCVPKKIDGTCGDLLEAMKWEKRNETRHTAYGAFYFDGRGWGDLDPGTALHWPIPGKELQVLQEDFYTFGGGENPEWEASLLSDNALLVAGTRLQMQNRMQELTSRTFLKAKSPKPF